MSYIIKENKVIGKTDEHHKDGMRVFASRLNRGGEYENNVLSTLRTLKNDPECIEAVISNAEKYKEAANKLDYSGILKKITNTSVEYLLLIQPPF